MRHVSRWLLLGMTFLLVTGSQAADVPNLRGSYEGTFVNASSHNFQAALLPYIEQDNLRKLSGQLALDGFNPVTFSGIINSNNVCTCFGSGAGTNFTFQARWERLGNGAGAVFGSANLPGSNGKARGTLFLFRGMTPTTGVKPVILGNYAGTFTTAGSTTGGTVVTQISDGTSNIVDGTSNIRIALGLVKNNVANQFALIGDVGIDRSVVAIGVNANGQVAVVRGYVEQDNLRGTRQLVATVQIKSAAGVVLSTHSIIAILIG